MFYKKDIEKPIFENLKQRRQGRLQQIVDGERIIRIKSIAFSTV